MELATNTSPDAKADVGKFNPLAGERDSFNSIRSAGTNPEAVHVPV